MNWHNPATFSQWITRWSSISNTGFICLTGIILILTFWFHCPEKIIGAYLASNNVNRPEKGAIWEEGQSIMAAKTHIEDIIKHREETRLNILQADSFSELAANLAPEQWVKIEKETLIRLYQALPEKHAHLLMDPLQLAWLIKANGASQILCMGKARGMSVYFMDANRQVMGVMEFSSASLSEIELSGNKANISLEQLPEFSANIYPAQFFFKAALRLPKDMLQNLVKNPKTLMAQPGTLSRVGISNQSESGYVRIGFEFHEKNQITIVQTKAREWAVWQLGLFLQENAP